MEMKSNIFDKNGMEVKQGSVVVFPYISPSGELTDLTDFKKEIVFKYGCYGFDTETKFIPLMEWMKTEQGEYISNCGNKVVYTDTYPFWVEKQ